MIIIDGKSYDDEEGLKELDKIMEDHKKEIAYMQTDEYKKLEEERRAIDILTGSIHYKKITDWEISKLAVGFLSAPLQFYEWEVLTGKEELAFHVFPSMVKDIMKLILSCEFSYDMDGCDREMYFEGLYLLVDMSEAIEFIEKGCNINLSKERNIALNQAKGLICEIGSYLSEYFKGDFDIDKKYKELTGRPF